MRPSIKRIVLDNGLTVILRELHHAPVVSFWIWYRVGSRNETPGITGASHWVEHMMFKGSPHFPAGTLDRLVSREGGHWNAFTTHDFTAYYETLPARHADLALRLEADRMNSVRMAEEDVEIERSIILSERQMYEDQPTFRLGEKLAAEAFRVHPYGHEVIGDEADLNSMIGDDLYQHYKSYYKPSNAVVVATGDFDSQEMVSRIRELFDVIPAGAAPPPVQTSEPPQLGERRVIVEGPGEIAYLAYAFHTPAANHSDFYPLVLLNAAYAGGSSLGFLGSITSNKSSRLYKSLVATDLAAAVSGNISPTLDPYLYIISAISRPGCEMEDLEGELESQLTLLADKPITQTELDKALKRAKAQYVMAGESVTGQAQMLGLAEVVGGDAHWYEKTLEAIRKVSIDDIERVRDSYLRKENRIVGIYEPTGLD